MTAPLRFHLTLRALPHVVPWASRMRQALKRMLRYYGLRCERIVFVEEHMNESVAMMTESLQPVEVCTDRLQAAFYARLTQLSVLTDRALTRLPSAECDTEEMAELLGKVKAVHRVLTHVCCRLAGAPEEEETP